MTDLDSSLNVVGLAIMLWNVLGPIIVSFRIIFDITWVNPVNLDLQFNDCKCKRSVYRVQSSNLHNIVYLP